MLSNDRTIRNTNVFFAPALDVAPGDKLAYHNLDHTLSSDSWGRQPFFHQQRNVYIKGKPWILRLLMNRRSDQTHNTTAIWWFNTFGKNITTLITRKNRKKLLPNWHPRLNLIRKNRCATEKTHFYTHQKNAINTTTYI